MYLYDGKSDIDWFYDGYKTREEMDSDLHYPPSDQPCVIFDNGAGKAYDWRYLSVFCDEYGVELTEDWQATFDAVLLAIENQPPELTLESVDEKATEAKTTADTAKQTATTIQEQMDALTSAFDAEVTANA